MSEFELRLTWSPRTCEEEYVYAHERDGSALSRKIRSASGSAGDGNDELGNCHTDGPHEQKAAPAQFLDEIEAGKCTDNINRICDDLNDKGVLEASTGSTSARGCGR